jgi:GNAT superfamily N-acetyltransferase
MTVTIRPLTNADHRAVTRLLDDAVGAGFWSLESFDEGLSYVAHDGADVIGVVLARLAAADGETAADAGAPGLAAVASGGDDGADDGGAVLHIRELAVVASHRRDGVATRLLRRVERDGRARGASLALVYAWLPAGKSDPESVPFYGANGYAARRDIPDFYGPSSVRQGAVCPYCGDPPCRCAARVLVRQLPASA